MNSANITASTVASLKQAAKAAKKEIVLNLCSQINKAEEKHNGKIPHGLINKLIKGVNDVSPGISVTRHDVRNMRAKWKERGGLWRLKMNQGLKRKKKLME